MPEYGIFTYSVKPFKWLLNIVRVKSISYAFEKI